LPVDHGNHGHGLLRERVTPAEHPCRELVERLRGQAQLDVVGRRRDRSGLGDDHRLLVLRFQAGCKQPLAQLQAVVRVVLPLHVPRDLAHPREERLDRAVVRPPEHGAPAIADEEVVRRRLTPHLVVEALQDLRRVHRLRL
jgi:hypothetical protein